MSRSLFDPSRMRTPAEQPPKTEQDAALSVSQLASKIERLVETNLPATVVVRGEVSSSRVRTHTYFDLKDDRASLSCVMFRSKIQRSRVSIEDGTEVIVRGQVTYYAKQGRVSFVVDSVELAGKGAKDAELRALCDELRAFGWFDESRKRAIPVFPRAIGVVTSRSAAALADVRATCAQRCPAIGIVLFDTLVQGERASVQVAAAIRHASSRAAELRIDAIVVTRGGGSTEDLWAFNDRDVARAIVESAVPVVVAIGHETDVTVAELVADRRAATPTQAAMVVSPDRDSLIDQLVFLHRRLDSQMSAQVTAQRKTLDELSPALGVATEALLSAMRDSYDSVCEQADAAVERSVSGVQLRCAQLESRLRRARSHIQSDTLSCRLGYLEATLFLHMSREIAASREDLGRTERQLQTCTHRASHDRASRVGALSARLDRSSVNDILSRGFSMTTLKDGTVVRQRTDAPHGASLTTLLSDGQIHSTVD